MRQPHDACFKVINMQPLQHVYFRCKHDKFAYSPAIRTQCFGHKRVEADEILEVGPHSILQTLKQDYDDVEKFYGTFKMLLDEQFVKWCCKKGRGLSIRETYGELNKLDASSYTRSLPTPNEENCNENLVDDESESRQHDKEVDEIFSC